jgi:hypothetical protein
MSALSKMPDLTRFDSERTVVTTNGGTPKAAPVHENTPDEEFPDNQTITAVSPAPTIAEPEFPDGGVRAWLVVCGVCVAFIGPRFPLITSLIDDVYDLLNVLKFLLLIILASDRPFVDFA